MYVVCSILFVLENLYRIFVLLLYIGIMYERTVLVRNSLHIFIITFPLSIQCILLFTLNELISVHYLKRHNIFIHSN